MDYLLINLMRSIGPFFIIGLLLSFIGNICAIVKLCNAARAKGYKEVGVFWVIGLFATAILLGIVVLNLPELSEEEQLFRI